MSTAQDCMLLGTWEVLPDKKGCSSKFFKNAAKTNSFSLPSSVSLIILKQNIDPH